MEETKESLSHGLSDLSLVFEAQVSTHFPPFILFGIQTLDMCHQVCVCVTMDSYVNYTGTNRMNEYLN